MNEWNLAGMYGGGAGTSKPVEWDGYLLQEETKHELLVFVRREGMGKKGRMVKLYSRRKPQPREVLEE